jgi:RNA polymerase sigma-70 factor (ECF subfamily)
MKNKILSYYKKLYGFAIKLTKSVEDAEDLTQNVILKALGKMSTYNEKHKLSSWLHTIMYNEFVNSYRRERLRQEINVNIQYANGVEKLSTVKTDSLVLTNEIQQVYNSVKHYDTLKMYIDGFKYHEIADKLSLPMGTVKSRIHKARKQFKEIYL